MYMYIINNKINEWIYMNKINFLQRYYNKHNINRIKKYNCNIILIRLQSGLQYYIPIHKYRHKLYLLIFIFGNWKN